MTEKPKVSASIDVQTLYGLHKNYAEAKTESQSEISDLYRQKAIARTAEGPSEARNNRVRAIVVKLNGKLNSSKLANENYESNIVKGEALASGYYDEAVADMEAAGKPFEENNLPLEQR